MAVYTIAQLKFTNVEAYRRYQKAFPAVFAKFNAKVLVADESPRVLEGGWPRDKIVILEFPDEAGLTGVSTRLIASTLAPP